MFRVLPSGLILFVAVIFASCSSSRKVYTNSNVSNQVVRKYAKLMDVSPKKIKNKALYGFINDWEGTKYRYGGLNKSGVDCSGLVYLIYKNVYKEEIPRSTSAQVNVIKRKYENQLKEGDLVFFNYEGSKISHVGLFLQNGYYVHASTRKGVMVQKLRDPYTYKYFSRCGSVKQ